MKNLVKPLNVKLSYLEALQETGTSSSSTTGSNNGVGNNNSAFNGNGTSNSNNNGGSMGNQNSNNVPSGNITVVNGSGGSQGCGADIVSDDILF